MENVIQRFFSSSFEYNEFDKEKKARENWKADISVMENGNRYNKHPLKCLNQWVSHKPILYHVSYSWLKE